MKNNYMPRNSFEESLIKFGFNKKENKFSDCYVFYDKLCDNYYYIDFYNSSTVFSIGNEFKITQDLYITRNFNMYKIYKIIKVIFRDFLKVKQNNKH